MSARRGGYQCPKCDRQQSFPVCALCTVLQARLNFLHSGDRGNLPAPVGQAERVERYRQRAALHLPLFTGESMPTDPLAVIGADMLRIANAHPWNPLTLRPPGPLYTRELELDGYRFAITLTRSDTTDARFYVLSIGEAALLPETTVQAVRAAVLPTATELGETMISRKFVLRTEKA